MKEVFDVYGFLTCGFLTEPARLYAHSQGE